MANYSGNNIPAGTPVSSETLWSVYDATFVPLTGTVSYAQRVFSSGLGVWCYYIGGLTSTPVSSATTPNWAGSITAYENLGPT